MSESDQVIQIETSSESKNFVIQHFDITVDNGTNTKFEGKGCALDARGFNKYGYKENAYFGCYSMTGTIRGRLCK